MRELRAKLPTYFDIWAKDSAIARAICDGVPATALPTPEAIWTILKAEQKDWHAPKDSVAVTSSYAAELAQLLQKEVEQAWQASFIVAPKVEVVDAKRFLACINDAQQLCQNAIGYGAAITSPPAIAYYALQNTIIVPDLFPIRTGDSRHAAPSCIDGSFDVTYAPWDRDQFTRRISEQLGRSLFRQLRGEHLDGYVRAYSKLSQSEAGSINLLNEICSLVQLEQTYRTDGEKLATLTDKISRVWQSEAGMVYYRGVIGLLESRTLAQACIVDAVITDKRINDRLAIEFFSSHPYNKMKQQLFFEKKP